MKDMKEQYAKTEFYGKILNVQEFSFFLVAWQNEISLNPFISVSIKDQQNLPVSL